MRPFEFPLCTSPTVYIYPRLSLKLLTLATLVRDTILFTKNIVIPTAQLYNVRWLTKTHMKSLLKAFAII